MVSRENGSETSRKIWDMNLERAKIILEKVSDVPMLEALVLASFVFNKPKEKILIHGLPKNEELNRKFFELVHKRSKGYPLQYIVKKAEFMGYSFYVEEGVFIPRNVTEELVEIAINLVKKFKMSLIADIGTGSGAIAISIAKMTGVRVLATDISEKAVKVAKLNASRLNVEDLVTIKKGEFLEPFSDSFEKIDLIVSNPPYVRENDVVSKEVLYEPKEAIFSGKTGVEFYEEFFRKYDLSGKLVLMEIDESNWESIQKITKGKGKVLFLNDLSKNKKFFLFLGEKKLNLLENIIQLLSYRISSI